MDPINIEELQDTMTFREARLLEEVTGKTLGESLGADGMAGLAFIALRRNDPDIEFESVLDMKLKILENPAATAEAQAEEALPEDPA